MYFIYSEHQWHYHSHLKKHLPFATHFRSPQAKCCWCRMMGNTGNYFKVPFFSISQIKSSNFIASAPTSINIRRFDTNTLHQNFHKN